MLTRDVRLTERQIAHGVYAVKARRRELERRLERTSYDGKPGMKDRVVTELAALRELEEILEVARKQIGHQLAAVVAGAGAPHIAAELERRAS